MSAKSATRRHDVPLHSINLSARTRKDSGIVRPSAKRLKMLQDADTILADCRDLVEQHGLDVETTRQAIKAMLDEQPVPLRGQFA